VKFLHNYPNGSLEKVMDSEVRSKLQAVFGLEVTDLPMDELRKNATPHINKTTKAVSDFFKERGLMITNLGITGGFVYKDKSIIDTMVKVFNAEQEKSVAIAGTNAQVERNKTVILEAQGKADAILKTKKAEADGIKLIAEAKAYELERAAKDRDFYLTLKQIDLEMNRLKSWDGKLPQSYFTGGGTGPMPTLLVPSPMLNKGSK
jgi:regulator of protease activity HflC (stomatin/prohibitin superfamily)